MDTGLTQIARLSSSGDPVVTWNFPIDISFKSTNAYGWPRITISVCPLTIVYIPMFTSGLWCGCDGTWCGTGVRISINPYLPWISWDHHPYVQSSSYNPLPTGHVLDNRLTPWGTYMMMFESSIHCLRLCELYQDIPQLYLLIITP